MPDEKVRYEEFRVDGDALVSKIKEILHEGNVRRLTIKNEKGDTLIEIPLTIGVVGAILLPVWAAIGAIAALAVNLTIGVERVADVSSATGSSVTDTPVASTPPSEPPSSGGPEPYV